MQVQTPINVVSFLGLPGTGITSLISSAEVSDDCVSIYYIRSSEIQEYIDEIYCIFYIFTSENIKFYIFTTPGCKYNFFGLPLTFPLTYCSALQNFKRQ